MGCWVQGCLSKICWNRKWRCCAKCGFWNHMNSLLGHLIFSKMLKLSVAHLPLLTCSYIELMQDEYGSTQRRCSVIKRPCWFLSQSSAILRMTSGTFLIVDFFFFFLRKPHLQAWHLPGIGQVWLLKAHSPTSLISRQMHHGGSPGKAG